MTTSVAIVVVVVLIVTVIVRVHSRRSHHRSIHLKRREYAVYYYKIELQLTSRESAEIT
jgi:hypothetical protein